jgi:hypothetical protein
MLFANIKTKIPCVGKTGSLHNHVPSRRIKLNSRPEDWPVVCFPFKRGKLNKIGFVQQDTAKSGRKKHKKENE